MKKQCDAIGIGGGAGGLSVASLLASKGVSPLLVEKPPYLGCRYRSI